MSAFPETSVTLLKKLAAQVTGEDEANWVRFADLYVPAIRDFARSHADGVDPDDIVQEVLANLVGVFRGQRFAVREGVGNFRAYLAKMIRNQLYMALRKAKARGFGRAVPIEDVEIAADDERLANGLDLEWAAARHRSAVEHVLTKTLVSPLNKSLYRAFVVEERPIDEVARTYGVTRNQVSQAKVRIGRMVEAIEAEIGG